MKDRLTGTIPASPWMAGLALGAALALHGGGAAWLGGASAGPHLAGSAPPAATALGNSFADLAAGSPARPAPSPPRAQAPAARPVAAPAMGPTTAQQPVQVNTMAATPVASRATDAPPRPARQAVLRDAVEPPVRTAAPSTAARTAKAAATAQGTKAARKGDANGQRTARAAASGSASKSTPDTNGQAEVTRYAGRLYRQINRARRETVAVPGVARLRLRIAGDGQLLQVDLAQSSGSARLDQVALAQVQRAAPFPPPPGGQSVFTLEIKGL